MGATKRLIEKQDSLESFAKSFLIENHYLEVALNGHFCTQTYSDDSEVYIKANLYYKNNNLQKIFSLTEFRDEIKYLLDISEFVNAFEYDLERMK